MNNETYDIAILGGGCAALNFAMAYAKTNHQMKVLIVEAKECYEHDRNWSFWINKKNNIFQHSDIIKKKWSAWSFSDEKTKLTHQSKKYYYATIGSKEFYEKAEKTIQNDDRLNLYYKNTVIEIEQNKSNELFEIKTQSNIFSARYIIDTRNVSQEKMKNIASFYQIFYGVEIQTLDAVFNPDCAGLMENMSNQNNHFSFIYTLPFSTHQALVEYTIFSPELENPKNLNKHLSTYIQKKYSSTNYNVIYKEHAVLPMGDVVVKKAIDHANYMHAGGSFGLLRESSGYGFMNIYNWAHDIVNRLENNNLYAPQSSKNIFINFLDHQFIKTLKCYSNNQKHIFFSIAKNMKADDFARFMIGEINILTLIKVIIAVPKFPFLRSLWN